MATAAKDVESLRDEREDGVDRSTEETGSAEDEGGEADEGPVGVPAVSGRPALSRGRPPTVPAEAEAARRSEEWQTGSVGVSAESGTPAPGRGRPPTTPVGPSINGQAQPGTTTEGKL